MRMVAPLLVAAGVLGIADSRTVSLIDPSGAAPGKYLVEVAQDGTVTTSRISIVKLGDGTTPPENPNPPEPQKPLRDKVTDWVAPLNDNAVAEEMSVSYALVAKLGRDGDLPTTAAMRRALDVVVTETLKGKAKAAQWRDVVTQINGALRAEEETIVRREGRAITVDEEASLYDLVSEGIDLADGRTDAIDWDKWLQRIVKWIQILKDLGIIKTPG